MHIDVWTAIECPWTYLGVRHLRQAVQRFEFRHEVTIRLHAYFLHPELTDAVELSETEFLAENSGLPREEVDQALAQLSALGAKEGIRFNWDEIKVAGTINAHRLVCLAREIDLETDTTVGADTLQMRLHEALQRARFEVGADLSNPDTLISLAQDFGIEAQRAARALENQEFADTVWSDFQIGVQMGVNSVPVFLFDRKFVVQGMQPITAFNNILGTAWEHTQPT